MLHWALDECARAGVERIVLVAGPDQPLIHHYLDAALAAGKGRGEDDLARLGRSLERLEIVRRLQPEPSGIGDALIRCRDVTGEQPFAVLLPDNWFDAEPPAMTQVAGAYRATGMCAFALTEIPPEEAALFGNVGGVDLEPAGDVDTYRVVRLQDKRPGRFEVTAGAVLRGCARYVVDGRFYDALLATGPPEEGEWDDVPAFQALIAEGALAARRVEGRHYDVGHPAGYCAAAAYLARRTRPSAKGAQGPQDHATDL
jgi:UTP--glucose-1-phosphate uridylyltransferase